MRIELVLLGLILFPILNIPYASATYCFETLPDGNGTGNDLCGLASGNITKVFLAANQPIESVQPGFALVILWGGILGIIWLKTERIDILGVVGIMVSGTITGLSPNATAIGFGLLLVSGGILLFQVLRQRVTVFT